MTGRENVLRFLLYGLCFKLPFCSATSGGTGRMFPYNYWPNGGKCIPYHLDSRFGIEDRRAIKRALKYIEQETFCLGFQVRTNETEYIRIRPGRRCEAYVGRIPGRPTDLRLNESCSKTRGILLHEILHTLGFFHEHSRPDRDEYVDIVHGNVQSGMFRNFAVMPNMPIHGTSYDLESIMHFPAFAFSVNRSSPTIIPRNLTQKIDQRNRLSRFDIIKIRNAYNCTNNIDQAPHFPRCGIDVQENLTTTTARTVGMVTARLPNPRCTYSEKRLSCEKANHDIPHTFDVDLVPTDLEYLVIDCIQSRHGRHCNALQNDAEPLPYRELLSKVSLMGFENANSSQFSMEKLLRNNKHIIELVVRHSKISSLESSFLFGFWFLETLDLNFNDINSVRADAFEGLTKIEAISLRGNRLQHLDWGVFLPAADSLEILDISEQKPKLRTLTRSSRKFSLRLTELHLTDNSLHFLPVEILESLRGRVVGVPVFDFRRNLFCLSSGQICNCCELADYMQWMKNMTSHVHDDRPVLIKFSCGLVPTDYINNDEGIAMLNLSEHCTGIPMELQWNYNGTPNVTVLTVDEEQNYYWIVTGLGICIPMLATFMGIALIAIWRRIKHNRLQKGIDYRDVLRKLVPADLTDSYELPRWLVRLTNHCVGYGQSGQVLKAFVKLRNIQNPVKSFESPAAVKILRKSHTTAKEEAGFLLEMSILMKIGRHTNIVNLQGIVLKEKLMMVMEYCELGALDEYLRSVHLCCNHGSPEQDWVRGNLVADEDQNVVNITRLISFACQISRGMAYLVSKGVIHRDLAARNILVTAARILKIADFGMAKCQLEYVLQRDQVPLPVRWMAPESIVSGRGVFSVASDVWSFGVAMWEIFTLGGMPYAVEFPKGLVYDQFCAFLNEGHRLSIPELCSASLASIMNECWLFVPSGRPTFGELCGKLADQLPYDVADRYVTFDTDNPVNVELLHTSATEAETCV